MASTAEIKIKLSNGQEAGKTINDLTAQSSKLAREIKKMEVGSEEYVKATEDYKKVAGRLSEVRKEAFATQKAQSLLNSEIGQFIPFNKQIGGMVTTFQGLAGAIKASALSQRALNVALAASGIGLILLALGKLVGLFLKTQEGLDLVTKYTRPLTAIWERLIGIGQQLGKEVFEQIGKWIKNPIQAFKDLGNAIVDNVINRFKALGQFGPAIAKIFSKEWKQGFKDLGNTVIQVGTGVESVIDKVQKGTASFKVSMEEALKIGKRVDELTKNIEKAEIDQIKRLAELANEYKKQSEIAENIKASDQERAKAAARAIEIADEEARINMQLLDMKIEKMTLEQKLNDTSREQQKELAQLQADRLNLETAAVERRTTARSKYNVAIQASEGKEKKAHDEAIKLSNERIKGLEAEQAARDKYIQDSISAEIKANEDRKKLDSDLLTGFKAYQQEQFDIKMQNLIRMADAEQRMIEEQFLTNKISQEERDQKLYESQERALKERLSLLMTDNQQSSAAYQELFMELLRLNHDYEIEKTEQTKEEEEKRKQIRDAGFSAAAGIAAGFASLLADSAKTSKKSLAVMKAAQSAEVGINTIKEVSGIFASTSGWGPLGWALGIAQAAIATARGAVAIKKINATQIEEGGSFAEGGPVFGPSHRDGGIPFSVAGSSGYEMEGGEIIMAKGVYQDPILRSVASQLNYLGGGRRFELGGPVSLSRQASSNQSTSSTPSLASALIDLRKTEMYLQTIAEATVATAQKPTISTYQIREDLKLFDQVERDATF